MTWEKYHSQKKQGAEQKKTLQGFQFNSKLSVFIELEKAFNIQEGQNLQLRYKYAINCSKPQV